MKEKISLLKSEILDDADRIRNLFSRFSAVWSKYLEKKEYSLLVECSFTVNQIYTGCERMFRNIAVTFENSIDDKLWHRALLERMRLDIENVRPRLISEESYTCLNDLLAFRHYFRHAYDTDIREDRFSIIASDTMTLKDLLEKDIYTFVGFLDKLKASL